MLRQKAKYFYEKIVGKSDFLASSRWLDKFCQQQGIWFLSARGECLSSNVDAVVVDKNSKRDGFAWRLNL